MKCRTRLQYARSNAAAGYGDADISHLECDTGVRSVDPRSRNIWLGDVNPGDRGEIGKGRERERQATGSAACIQHTLPVREAAEPD